MESLESYKINLIVGPPQSFYPPQFQFASLPQQRNIRTFRGKGLKNDTMLHTPHSPLIILLFYHCWHFWFVSSLWTFNREEHILGSKFFFYVSWILTKNHDSWLSFCQEREWVNVWQDIKWGEIEWSPVLRHQIQTGCLFHNVFIIISFYIATVHSLFCLVRMMKIIILTFFHSPLNY